MDTSTFTNCLSSTQPCFPEKVFDRLDTKEGQISNFLSSLYSKPMREYRKPKFKIGDEVRISKYDLTFIKGYKPQFTQEAFEIVAISS